MRKLNVPMEELKRMYEVEQMSAKQIGERVGLTAGGVLHHLRKLGCAMRSNSKPEVNTEQLIGLYTAGRSPESMSAEVGLSVSAIRYRLRKAGMMFREVGWGNRKTPTAELTRLYVEEQLSLNEAARATGMSKGAIRSRLKREGIERRSPMARGWLDPKRKPTEHPTMMQIAWAAGCYEGEGSVLPRNSAYGGKSPIVSLTQKDDWLCARLRALFGGQVRKYQMRGRFYNYWRLTGPRGIGFLMTIYSFLSPRRKEQVRVAFAEAGILRAAT
jgi:hypothetical protein